MKKIGLFYATKADKTTWVAEKIQKEFGKDKIEVVPIEQAWQNDFAAYDCFIVGASTWFDGELPTYWDELLPELRTLDLKGKKVAIFGLGDQIRYPENFADRHRTAFLVIVFGFVVGSFAWNIYRLALVYNHKPNQRTATEMQDSLLRQRHKALERHGKNVETEHEQVVEPIKQKRQ